MTISYSPENDPKDSQDPVEDPEEIAISQENMYLRKKVEELRDEKERLISLLRDKDTSFSAESFLISNINVFTNNYVLENKELLDTLSEFTLQEIDEFIKANRKNLDQYTDDDYKRESFLYHYRDSREIYERVFKYFENLNNEPERFWIDLIWILDIIFNLELFICTKKIHNCRGFIFNLESGFGYENRMGMVLTPLAFKSSKVLLNTLFHELAHRIYYIELHNEGVTEIDIIEHEWHAYYQDKFLQNFFSVELNWLDEVLDEDIFESSEEISENFLSEVFKSSIKDIQDTYKLMQNVDESEALYSPKALKKKYYRAIRLTEVPRNYSCVTEFICFFNDKVANLYKANVIELEMVHWIIFMLLIIYSRKYEKKYHIDNNIVYNNIIFSPVGDLDKTGVMDVKRYASILRYGYENG